MKAIITGVTGQDGSYLSELLLSKEYEVIGIKRRSSTNTTERLGGVLDHENFTLIEGDVTDPSSMNSIVNKYKPDELYNTAGQSHVQTSFEQPSYTFQVNAVGVLNILEAIRLLSPTTRLLQFSTSEMFGSNFLQGSIIYNEVGAALKDELAGVPYGGPRTEFGIKYQDENTPLSPNSPYAASKVAAHHLVNNYREAYGLHASCAINFNHESPRRGEEFVTRKITKWIAQFENWRNTGRQAHKDIPTIPPGLTYNNFDTKVVPNFIYCGMDCFPKLRLGNLDAKRDWGHAKDYVQAMWMMLQQEKPDDYVIATGKTYSVRDFLSYAFKEIGIDDWEPFVVIDPKFYRPVDVEYLLGRADKAKRVLGWEPKIAFEELVKEMVEFDIARENK